MKKSRFIKEVIKAAESRGATPPAVNFDGERCPGYDGNMWAHYHPDRHVICVPINMLRQMSEAKLVEVAVHEVAHIFDQSHDASFYQEMHVTAVSSWVLPGGVSFAYEGMYRAEIKRDKRKKRVDKTRCNNHSCRKKRKLEQCPHCDCFYCNEHIATYSPGKADINSLDSSERERGYERESLETDGHACAGYVTHKKREKEKRLNAMQKFLDRDRVTYIIPLGAVCDYETCSVKLKDEGAGHLCKSCNKTFCKEHKELEDHNCVVLELGTVKERKNDKVPRCQTCGSKFKENNVEYTCINCKESLCVFHREPEKHNCTSYEVEEEGSETGEEICSNCKGTGRVRVTSYASGNVREIPCPRCQKHVTAFLPSCSFCDNVLKEEQVCNHCNLVFCEEHIDTEDHDCRYYPPRPSKSRMIKLLTGVVILAIIAALIIQGGIIPLSTTQSPPPNTSPPTTTPAPVVITEKTEEPGIIPPISERDYTIITIYDPLSGENLDGEIQIDYSNYGETQNGEIQVYFKDIPDKEQKSQFIEPQL